MAGIVIIGSGAKIEVIVATDGFRQRGSIRARQVLVVEDEPADVFFLKQAFATLKAPSTLHFVGDGKKAMDYLSRAEGFSDRKAHPLPDFMLLDLKMPQLDGFQVLKWLRQQPGLRRLPVIIFSSSTLPQDIDRAYELGANSFLVKPQDPEPLVDLVRRLQEYWLELNQAPQ